jgi:hypothetical protein
MVIDQRLDLGVKNKNQDGRQKVRKRWAPPGRNHAKLNTDGAFLNSNEAGIGMVLRDHEGQVIVAACREVT